MSKRVLILLGAVVIYVVAAAFTSRSHTVYIVGDSTAAMKRDYSNPERGWGMMLQECFDEGILVDNHAVNGRSSRSFREEGRWQKVVDKLHEGDYVIIQFGHNDEKADPKRHTSPDSFAMNLRRYVEETRAKGAVPILMSPVARRCFFVAGDGNSDDEKLRDKSFEGEEIINSDTMVDTHGIYRLIPRQVAAETHCLFIDANGITTAMENHLGPVKSRQLHMWYKPGEQATMPQGRQDNTHYNIYGARLVARALARQLATAIPEFHSHLIIPSSQVCRTTGHKDK